MKLASHFTRKGAKCIYRYDFGDCRDHLVELKADDFGESDVEQTRERLGKWDPEAFDLEAAKKEFDR